MNHGYTGKPRRNHEIESSHNSNSKTSRSNFLHTIPEFHLHSAEAVAGLPSPPTNPEKFECSYHQQQQQPQVLKMNLEPKVLFGAIRIPQSTVQSNPTQSRISPIEPPTHQRIRNNIVPTHCCIFVPKSKKCKTCSIHPRKAPRITNPNSTQFSTHRLNPSVSGR